MLLAFLVCVDREGRSAGGRLFARRHAVPQLSQAVGLAGCLVHATLMPLMVDSQHFSAFAATDDNKAILKQQATKASMSSRQCSITQNSSAHH